MSSPSAKLSIITAVLLMTAAGIIASEDSFSTSVEFTDTNGNITTVHYIFTDLDNGKTKVETLTVYPDSSEKYNMFTVAGKTARELNKEIEDLAQSGTSGKNGQVLKVPEQGIYIKQDQNITSAATASP